MVDFARDSTNAPDDTSPRVTIAGRYFRVGLSTFRGVQKSPLYAKFGAGGDFDGRSEKFHAAAPLFSN